MIVSVQQQYAARQELVVEHGSTLLEHQGEPRIKLKDMEDPAGTPALNALQLHSRPQHRLRQRLHISSNITKQCSINHAAICS
jgi:hypothetical protein